MPGASSYGTGNPHAQLLHTVYGQRQEGAGGVANIDGANRKALVTPAMRGYKEPKPKSATACVVEGCKGYRMKSDPNGRCAGHAGVIGGRKHGAGRQREVPNEAE